MREHIYQILQRTSLVQYSTLYITCFRDS